MKKFAKNAEYLLSLRVSGCFLLNYDARCENCSDDVNGRPEMKFGRWGVCVSEGGRGLYNEEKWNI